MFTSVERCIRKNCSGSNFFSSSLNASAKHKTGFSHMKIEIISGRFNPIDLFNSDNSNTVAGFHRQP